MNIYSSRYKGFTLIEILVVIGIIAILATVVLVAVNPSRQFKLARDSQRTANIHAILNAIQQNISEHKGVFVCGNDPKTLPTDLTVIKSGIDNEFGNIAPCLVPDYISALPFDPSRPGAHYTSADDYNTEYSFQVDASGRLMVMALSELTDQPISVTR